jgi:hypothetical protein
MAIPIQLPAEPVWPRVFIVVGVVIFLWVAQYSCASGTEVGGRVLAQDAANALSRLLLPTTLGTVLAYFFSENYKLSAADTGLATLVRVGNIVFFLGYWACSTLLWAAMVVLVERSRVLTDTLGSAALPLVYIMGLAAYLKFTVGLPNPTAALVQAAALQCVGVYATGYLLATYLGRQYPHNPNCPAHDFTLGELRAFLHDDAAAALAALLACAVLQFALFTPMELVLVDQSAVDLGLNSTSPLPRVYDAEKKETSKRKKTPSPSPKEASRRRKTSSPSAAPARADGREGSVRQRSVSRK